MNNKGVVSVIIPNYNNAKWLQACVNSCLEQGELLKEIIVVDDHSDDESLEILKLFNARYPDIVKIYHNPEKGANSARNYGFEKCSGKYIQWLDSDDMLLKGKFEAQIPPLRSGTADIVYSDWRIDHWDNDVMALSENRKAKRYGDYLLELVKDNWINSNNYLITRKTAEKLAGGVGWNPETVAGQDREYFTLAGIMGAKFTYIPGCYSVYNKQNSGTISGIDFRERLRFNQILEKRLRDEIAGQQWISVKKKNEYFSVFDTHKLKACFYDRSISLDRPIPLKNIQWDMMHWKIRMVMPIIYLYKHIQYYL